MRLRKAIIPAAGLGTRMRAITRDLPKELLSVGGRPLIAHTIEALIASSIRQIAVVISPAKESIRRFLLGDPPDFLPSQPDASLRLLLRACEFSFFVQPRPTGLADAVSLCREFIDNEPFALVLPDNLLLDGLPPVVQMLPFFSEKPRHLIGAIRLRPADAGRFGNVGILQGELLSGESPRLLRICHYSAKKEGTLQAAAEKGVLKGFGGGIHLPHYLDFIEQCRAQARGEMDDVPVLQALTRERLLFAVQLVGRGFDVGNPAGYWAASLYAESRQAAG